MPQKASTMKSGSIKKRLSKWFGKPLFKWDKKLYFLVNTADAPV